MKKVISILLSLAIIITMPGSISFTGGNNEVKAAENVLASGDFSGGSFSGSNMYFSENTTNPSGETYVTYEVKGNRTGIRINRGKYGYFRTLNDVVSSNDNKLAVAVTYYDEMVSGMFIEYNASDGQNYKRITAPGEETGRWRTVTFYMDDALFRRAQNNGGDFRISSGGSVLISKVEIYRHNNNPRNEPVVTLTRDTTKSEFTGKSFAGYQGWYGIGTQYNSWNHYAGGSADPDGTSWPRKDHISIDYFPDVTEFAESSVAQTGFANLGNGNPTKLYKSNTEDVFDVHFGWMEEYGIDGVAVQRFLGGVHTSLQDDPTTNFYSRIMRAAEDHDRLVYLMYDLSGGVQITDSSDTTSISPFVKQMEFDWVYNVEKYQHLTESDAYATVNGKPVVCVYGLGIGGRPNRIVDYKELIDFFHERGCYVIIGTSRGWRSQTDNLETIESADMISPWMVGVMQNQSGIDYFYDGSFYADALECQAKGIGYQPVIYSGFSWGVWAQGAPNGIPRNAGQFLWYQAYKVKQKLGINSVFVAVFDEFDEGTAFAKNASDYFDIPTDQYFVTASCDGYWLSSDFQLRTVGEAIRMVKGQRPAVTENPVEHSLGPVYYRNSFEKRYLNAADDNYSGIYPIDPCFKNEAQLSAVNASATVTDAENENAKTGDYTATISGTATNLNSSYAYRISETKIKIRKGMKLSYSVYAENAAGRNTYVDLILDDGTYVSTLGFSHNNSKMGKNSPKGSVGSWSDYEFTFGTDELAGKTITAVALCYNGGAADFGASYDNIIIEDGNPADIEILTEDVYIDYTQTPFDAQNMRASLNINGETTAEFVTVKGKNAVHLDRYKYAYIRTLNDRILQTDNDLLLEVTYYDEGTGSIAIQYNSLEDGNYKAVYIPRTDSKRWKTKTIEITDASFRHAQNNGADFRMYSSANEGITIAKVAVKKQFNVSSYFTSGDYVGENMNSVINKNGETDGATYVEKEGTTGINIAQGKYAYFRVLNDAITRDDHNIIIEFTYFDEGTSNIAIQYNAIGNNYKDYRITKTGTNSWKTEYMRLTDAEFKKGTVNGADFRLRAGGSEGSTIASIVIKRMPIEDTLSEPASYTVTVDGVEDATVYEGDEYTLPTTANAGYECGGKMYRSGSTITVDDDMDFASVSVTSDYQLSYLMNANSGIQYKMEVEGPVTSDIKGAGAVLVTASVYKLFKNVTKALAPGRASDVTANEIAADGTFKVGLAGLSDESTYIEGRRARAYLDITYTGNGETNPTTVYGTISEENSLRAMATITRNSASFRYMSNANKEAVRIISGID